MHTSCETNLLIFFKAEQEGQKAYIVAHIPPGSDTFGSLFLHSENSNIQNIIIVKNKRMIF